MSEIKNGSLGLYGAEHWKCDHMMTLGFKGLNSLNTVKHPQCNRTEQDIQR